MKIRTIRYLIKEGILSIWKNRLMSLASIGTIVLCLIVLGISYSIASNVDFILHQIESNIGITAYISDKVKEEEIASLKSKIENTAYVTSVTYISKDQALESFSKDSSLENVMEQFKEDNPLPASFEIRMDELENQDAIIKALEVYPELELSYFQAEAPMLVELNRSIRLISTIIIASLTMVGILLMSNTIKLTVYIRRKEINIMKYIGAADWFIRAPFVIEGVIIGLIGGVIPIFTIWSTYTWTLKAIEETFGLMMDAIQLQETAVVLAGFIPMCLILGVSIGAIGSVISIRKHLQV